MNAKPFEITEDGTRLFVKNAIIRNGYCLEWNGKTNDLGYGQMYLGGTMVMAHRYSYILFVGDIVDLSLEVDHQCNNRKCVNPMHLKLMTRKDNVLRSGAISAIYARRTECARGHKFDEYIERRDGGGRRCRICKRASDTIYARRYRAKKRMKHE